MYPILFEWGPIRIGSYGVMLALAFISAIVLTNREFRKQRLETDLAWDIYLFAIGGGMIGSRILYILENWSDFLRHPTPYLFSVTGFSVIGGYLLAVSLCVVRIRRSGEPFLKIADMCAPGMTSGYAVGRIGCLIAGDGCYGQPTQGWWGMCFPNGLVSTLSQKNHLLRRLYLQLFPGSPVPADIAVHPTPLYETTSHFLLLFFLLWCTWRIGTGRRFAFFLGWFGISRFLVEFIRLNPPGPLGLTSDQWLAGALVLVALTMRVVFPVKHVPDTGGSGSASENPGGSGIVRSENGVEGQEPSAEAEKGSPSPEAAVSPADPAGGGTAGTPPGNPSPATSSPDGELRHNASETGSLKDLPAGDASLTEAAATPSPEAKPDGDEV